MAAEGSLGNSPPSDDEIFFCTTMLNREPPITSELLLALKQHEDIEEVRRILCRTEDINLRHGEYWRTSLQHAITWNCDLPVVEALIAKGADVNAKDVKNMTALHLAVLSPTGSKYVPELLSRGADVNAETQKGETPLYLAVTHFNNWVVVKILLEYGANTDHVNDDFLSFLGFHSILEKAVFLKVIPCAKVLVKIIFLKNFVHNFFKITEIKENPKIANAELALYMANCISELELMQNTKLNHKYSVLDFAKIGQNMRPLFRKPELTYSQLSIMFPIYHEIIGQNISSALQRGECIKQCNDIQIQAVSYMHKDENEGRRVGLNFDCIENILKFLTTREMLNFTQALPSADTGT